MVVPDTSVWIEFLRQNTGLKELFLSLLESRQIVAHEPIFAELLYGVRKPKDKELVLSYWHILPKLEFRGGSLLEAAQFANDQNYHNLGVGLMDVAILLPVLRHGYQLWTLDKRILGVLNAATRFE